MAALARSVFVPQRPSALAESNRLSTAPVRKPRLRTPLQDPAAPAVSLLSCLFGSILFAFLPCEEAAMSIRSALTLILGARPAGECTCDRAAQENAKPAGSTCACGARPASTPPSLLFLEVSLTLLQTLAAARKPLMVVFSPPRRTSRQSHLALRIGA